ncbi:MAG: cation:proton antiporter [Myxococcales bacterium]
MSASAPTAPLKPAALLTKAGALGVIIGISAWVNHIAPAEVAFAAPVAALGLLLLGGDLLAELVERLKLPHLTGYLLAGVLVGPHVLGTISARTVEQLSLVNALALSLIALSAGAELTLELLRRGLGSLVIATLSQILLALPLAAASFLLARPFLPFLDGMELPAALGVALLWGVLSVSRSPAVTLGLIAQVRPDGPLTRYSLSLVIAFDIVVLVLFAVAIQVARTLLDPGAGFELSSLAGVGEELIGSIAAGTTLGLLVVAYLRIVGRQLILFLVVMSYGVAQFASYFHYDSLLLFVTAGFVVANVSHQGEKLLEAVSQGGRVVYVLFFANAGAHLDLPLLGRMWPIALSLAAARVVATVVAQRVGSRIAKDPEPVRRYGWMPLVSQAGVTLGMVVVLASAFADSFGPGLSALAIAVVGLNEAAGPVLFKIALDRAGETGKAGHAGAPAESQPAAPQSAPG